MAKMLDNGLEVSKFVFQSRYYIHFQIKPSGNYDPH